MLPSDNSLILFASFIDGSLLKNNPPLAFIVNISVELSSNKYFLSTNPCLPSESFILSHVVPSKVYLPVLSILVTDCPIDNVVSNVCEPPGPTYIGTPSEAITLVSLQFVTSSISSKYDVSNFKYPYLPSVNTTLCHPLFNLSTDNNTTLESGIIYTTELEVFADVLKTTSECPSFTLIFFG